jgi:hypothetical protein
MDPFLMIPILFVVGILGALATFPWASFRLGQGWPWFAAPLVPPIAAYVVGWTYQVSPGNRHPASTAVTMLWLLVLASAALVVITPLLLKGRRLFGASLAVAMVGATMAIAFVAGMQVTGDWI